MTRNFQILLATHLLAFGMAFELAKTVATGDARPKAGPPLRTKAGVRDTDAPVGQGDQLLSDFTSGRGGHIADIDSKYLALKASLPAAKDVKAAAIAEIGTLDRFWKEELPARERRERMARLEVMTLHWMREDPAGAMDFLLTDETCKSHRLPDDLCGTVFKDIVAEKGLAESLGWLSKSPRTAGVFCDAALAAMKQDGGGIGSVAKLVSAMERNPGQTRYLDEISRGSYVSGRPIAAFFTQVGGAVRFDEREKLMEFAKSQTEERSQLDLLESFARTGPEAAAWLQQAADGTLKDYVAERVTSEAAEMRRRNGSVPLDERVAIIEASAAKDHLPANREDIVSRLVRRDVEQLLKTGRDWSYEFHHGDVSADEVLSQMKSALPGISAEGESAMREALYEELAKENPQAALPLIADFPEEERREILFGQWSLNFSTADPGLYCSFLATLPEPRNPGEKERMQGGLAYLAKQMLDDGGVFWKGLDAVPAAARSGAAMDVIVSETRKVDPGKAAKLEKLFSTLRP